MKSLLITGSNGFIGSRLTLNLLEQGYRVGVINRQPRKQEYKINYPAFQDFCYDGSSNSIKNALVLSEPELVIHLASYFVPRHKPDDVSSLIASNIDFPAKLLDEMAQLKIKKFINTGTYWQHYQNADYDPVSLYAATKQSFEDILVYYINSEQVDAITLKLFDTYGTGDTRKKILNLLLDAIMNGTTLKLSPGEQKLSLVHVDDVVSAYEIAINLLLSRSGYQHSCFGISHFEVFSLKEIATLVENVTNRSLQAEWGALPYREREVMNPWSKYECLPGWQAKISLEEGVKRLVKSCL